jgi:hypothetical protein
MSDTRFTHELKEGLDKAVAFVEGLPVDAVDTLKIVATVTADIATIKGQIGDGNYVSIISGLQSDISALKAEVVSLVSQVKLSLESTATAQATASNAQATASTAQATAADAQATANAAHQVVSSIATKVQATSSGASIPPVAPGVTSVPPTVTASPLPAGTPVPQPGFVPVTGVTLSATATPAQVAAEDAANQQVSNMIAPTSPIRQ